MAAVCLNINSFGTAFRATCISSICLISCSFDASGSGLRSHQGTSLSDLGSSGSGSGVSSTVGGRFSIISTSSGVGRINRTSSTSIFSGLPSHENGLGFSSFLCWW